MELSSLLVWRPHPDAWLLVGVLAGAYVYALSAWAPRRPAATGRQKAAFAAGIAVLWLASDWPVHTLADQLFSVHMLQHTLYSLVAAPLLLLGVPSWLYRRLLRNARVFALARSLTRPLIAFGIFNAWIALYHWPALVNLSVTSDAFHALTHVVWVLTAALMWWPVLSPLPELPHLSYPLRMGYLFAQSIVPTVPASFLTFSSTPLYSAYVTSTAALGIDAVHEQQVAGLLMKMGGGLILFGVIAVLFFRWATQERTAGPDPLYWRDLERDLGPELQADS